MNLNENVKDASTFFLTLVTFNKHKRQGVCKKPKREIIPLSKSDDESISDGENTENIIRKPKFLRTQCKNCQVNFADRSGLNKHRRNRICKKKK